MKNRIEQIKYLIGKDKLQEAIKEMDYLCANDSELELIIQSSRFSNIKKKIRLNLVNNEDRI